MALTADSGGVCTPPSRLRLHPAALRVGFAALAKLAINARRPIAVQRAAAGLGLLGLPSAPGTTASDDTIGGVPGRRIRLDGGARAGALLYLHGGGYVVGSGRGEQSLGSHLAAGIGVDAFLPDYQLGPEHTHPAALDDALAAYEALLVEGVPEGRIVVAGESAGGGLALALAMAARDRGLPAPALLGLLCPWVDLTPAAIASVDSRAQREPLIDSAIAELWASAYAGDAPREHPHLSPLHGDLGGLPPIEMHSGADDPLCADAEALERRALAAGTRVDHRIHPGMTHGFPVGVAVSAQAHAAVEELASAARTILAPVVSPRVVVVGAGMSGICMGSALRRAGVADLTIYEQADEVGGTWRDNTYPGLSCDVPARHYCYSFRTNPDWRSAYAPGPELRRYFADSARELGLEPHLRTATKVETAHWDGARWQLTLDDGTTDAAEILVCATGVLRIPHTPEIPGLDRFDGPAFHSAEWDHGVPLDGRRIAVVGAGSTGVQLVTALSERAAKVVSIQRTPQWVLPVPQWGYTRAARRLRRRFPALDRLSYRGWQWILERTFGTATVEEGIERRLMSAACRAYLRFGVRDPELRRKLLPKDLPLCKRIVMSDSYYRAVQRPTVEVVTEAVDHVEREGIVTADGRLHEVDAIVFATGFQTHAFMRPMDIIGVGGVELEGAWSPDPRAYLSVALAGFPNFFMLLGPHSPIGNISLTAIVETQVAYVMRFVELVRAGALTAASPLPSATERFNRDIRDAMPNTIWTSGCQSWYLASDGTPELFPWTPQRHREMLAAPRLDEFELVGAG